jgi:hypothetical protein
MAGAPDDLRAKGVGPAPLDLPHRGGTRVQVGTPIHVGGEKPWMCAVKLMGPSRELTKGADLEEEPTQTLLLRTGRGASPEEAQRNALAQLTHVYGHPGEPAPQAVILQKQTDPPPPPAVPRRSWLQRLVGLFWR